MERRRYLHALAAGLGLSVGSLTATARTPASNGDTSRPEYTIETRPAQGSDWTQRAKLAAGDGDEQDRFGEAAAVSGDGSTAIVGAQNDEDPNGKASHTIGGAGSAYVFAASGGGWSQEAKLAADDGDESDHFGESVAVSGDGSTVIIGADGDEDPNGQAAGSAYVFAESGGEWSQRAKLTPDDGDDFDWFGRAVAVSGDGSTAVIGAPNDEDPNGTTGDPPGGAGSAYVFTESGGEWSQEAKLAAQDGDREDLFGQSVAVSRDGSSAIVGAWWDEDPNGMLAGSAYVFTESGGEWSQEAKLAAEDGEPQDEFGVAVSMSGDGSTAIVGADNDEGPNGEREGSAYVFATSGGGWSQEAKLVPEDGDGCFDFGQSVGLAGDGKTAVIGCNSDADPNGERAGSAYVFVASGGDWHQQAKLAAGDGDRDDNFGVSVSVSAEGRTALIGARTDEDPNGKKAGSAYVFETAGDDSPEDGTQTVTREPTTTATAEEQAEAGESTPGPNDSAAATPGADGPGFGLGTALTALGATGYALLHKTDEIDSD